MTDVKRKKSESFESLLRRFNRRMQESGRVLQVRKTRFYAEKPNKTQTRSSAIRRKDMREKREYMLKTGKLKEEEMRGERRY
ncbi:MAG: 30S ribosomal protein S21 [bacterium]